MATAGCGSVRDGQLVGTTDTGDVGADVEDALPPPPDTADTGEPADASPDAADAADAADPTDAIGDAVPDTSIPPPPECPWKPYDEGLRGGAVRSVAFDPRTPDVVFATTGAVLHRSVDRGETWQRWSESEFGIRDLEFAPHDIKRIMASSGGGVLESNDGGLTFELKALQGFQTHSLLMHPASPQRVLAGTNGAGILRSSDGGASWGAVNSGVPLARVVALAAPDDDPERILAGIALLNPNLGATGQGQVLLSRNGGAAWEVAIAGVGWGNDIVYCTADTVFAAVRKGVARSDDGGETWETLPAFGALDVLNIGVSPDCETIHAAAYQVGMFRSDDGGLTASGPHLEGIDLQPDRFATNRVAIDPADRDRVLIATYGGLYVSADGGERWRLSDVGQGIAGLSLAADPSDPARLLMTSWGTGVWTRPGPGEAWGRLASTALPRDFIFSASAVEGASGPSLYVGTVPDLWRSDADGASFSPLALPGNVFHVVALPSGDLLAATQTGGLRRSADDGETWAPSNGDLTPWATPNGTFIDARRIAVLPGGDRILVGTQAGGVLISDDDGHTWGAPETIAGRSVIDLAVDPHDGDTVYGLAPSRGVYVSHDRGDTWTLHTSGLANLALNDMAIDPVSGAIFVSTASSGVYRSMDAASWLPFDRWCLPVAGFGPLAIMEDGEGRWLVGAAAGSRVYRHRLGP